jgi:hypothetical protein
VTRRPVPARRRRARGGVAPTSPLWTTPKAIWFSVDQPSADSITWPAPGATSRLCRESFTKRPFDALPSSLLARIDVLVVNAPYVPTREMGLLPMEARVYEPPVALDGGPDAGCAFTGDSQGSWQLVGTRGSSAGRGRRAAGVVCRPDDAACRPTTHVERCRRFGSDGHHCPQEAGWARTQHRPMGPVATQSPFGSNQDAPSSIGPATQADHRPRGRSKGSHCGGANVAAR